MSALAGAALLVGAYLIGSIPSGYLLVRACRGVDVRDYGSHNVGAINTLRVGGVKLGLWTLLADIGKGALMVVAASLTRERWLIAGAAFLVLLGHAFSFWLFLRDRRFSEGKSVASALGVLLSLVLVREAPWPVAMVPLGVWAAGLLGPRLVTGRWWCISPATMAAAVSVPVTACLTGTATPYRALAVLLAGLLLVRHRHNIERLLAGTEPKLGRG